METRKVAVLLGAVMVSLAAIMVLVDTAKAVPLPSHIFFGDVTVGGAPAADGLTIEACIGGVNYAKSTQGTTTTKAGTYGTQGKSDDFQVRADDTGTPALEGGVNGQTVVFFVKGVQATTSPSAVTFKSAEITRVDLSVTSVPSTFTPGCAPPPEVTPTATATRTVTATATTVTAPGGGVIIVPATETPTPTATATAAATATAIVSPTATATATPVSVVPKTTLPAEVTLSPNTTVRDDQGNVIQMTPGGVISLKTEAGVNRITLPFALPIGRTVGTLFDPVSGVRVERLANGQTLVSMPVKDAAGKVQMTIKATLDALTGTGTTATGVITKLEMEIPPTTVNLALTGPVEVSISAILNQMPQGASIQVSISKEPDTQTRSSFVLAATGAGTEITDIGFSVNIIKENLDQVVGAATLKMKVGKAWVDTHGAQNLRGFRKGDDGKIEILETKFIGFEGESALFEIVSPNGLSVFALVALKRPPVIQPTPTATPVRTPTPTATPAPTPTAVATPRPTAVPTVTPTTVLAAPTATPPRIVPTPTPTALVAVTITPQPSPTATAVPAAGFPVGGIIGIVLVVLAVIVGGVLGFLWRTGRLGRRG
ncbi:MAG: hypothetical protein HYU29_03445 [Chloroflexi bacterium]|nr:hypothetical protein [Chloroflexota bacterium]